MIGLGTIINVIGIIFGGLIGIFCKRLITHRIQDTLMKANGVCVLFLGIAGTLEQMLSIEDGHLSSNGTMMMILSLSIGVLIGECINLDYRMEQFGQWLKNKTGNAKDSLFVDGFVTASLTVCIGAMAIVGALQGSVTLLATCIEPLMTEAALSNLSLVGNMLIFCVGVNLVWDNTKIKVANMLPAILVAIAWAFLPL